MNKHYIKYKPQEGYYNASDIKLVLDKAINKHMLYGNNKGIYCYNCPCAFDIETSSFYVDDGTVVNYTTMLERQSAIKGYKPEKVAIMYVWQLGINGYVVIGRTWYEFVETLQTISEYLKLDTKHRLLIYVHNLAYEFQFIRKWFEWDKVFSIDNRKPVYAITTHGIEFRCSLILSGYSLANLAKQLQKYKMPKLVGELDYQLIRHSETPLTQEELSYCINDVQIVMSYIHDCITNEGTVMRIPLTKTGYVRRYCKEHTLKVPNTRQRDRDYIKLIKELTINSVTEFDMIQDAFMGGFTHANPRHCREVLYDVSSYDFTSSYPYVLLAEKYPMSQGSKVDVTDIDHFNMLLDNFCCVFRIAFKGIRAYKVNEHYISISKCHEKLDYVVDNGRLVSAKYISLTITNVDYEIIKDYYTWDGLAIGTFYAYKRDYLPTPLIKCILKFYEDKTKLKGVEDREVDYMQGKAMLNSVYGMCVTNPLRDEYNITSDGEIWSVTKADGTLRVDLLDLYNNSSTRFLYYLWGIFCTAYARYNLFTAITALDDDYIYADTDSVKLLNHDKHLPYFIAYNRIVENKLRLAAKIHHIDFDSFQPKNNRGERKLIGVWDFEGTYTSFKTLGAKRYAIESYDSKGNPNAIRINGVNYNVSITVSGVNKYTAIPYLFDDLAKGSVDKFMSNFNEGLHVPSGYSGKLLHTYIDDVKEGDIIDYLGNSYHYLELSSVHLEPTSYDLSLASEYIAYLKGIRDKSI